MNDAIQVENAMARMKVDLEGRSAFDSRCIQLLMPLAHYDQPKFLEGNLRRNSTGGRRMSGMAQTARSAVSGLNFETLAMAASKDGCECHSPSFLHLFTLGAEIEKHLVLLQVPGQMKSQVSPKSHKSI